MLKNGINKYDIEKSFYINNNFINSHNQNVQMISWVNAFAREGIDQSKVK